jgi:hypothetical protein
MHAKFPFCMQSQYKSSIDVFPAIFVYFLSLLQVNDAIIIGDDTLVSCSSDTTIKVFPFLPQKERDGGFASFLY